MKKGEKEEEEKRKSARKGRGVKRKRGEKE